MRKIIATLALALGALASHAMPLGSRHAIIVDEHSGSVLYQKDADRVVPIASLTKLMTAMVVLDAGLDMDEIIMIDERDVDTLKHSSSRVPVGSMLSRRTLLELALMSSDNRAAAALGRTFPGGRDGFLKAVQRKAADLGMRNTTIWEPTGLSPYNTSTAQDLVKMTKAAAAYPQITAMSTTPEDTVEINGRAVEYRNTNRLVANKDWDIQLSKTGFTSEAGRCLTMRLNSAGRQVIMVLLNAQGPAARTVDAVNVRRFLTGEPFLSAVQAKTPAVKTRAGRKAPAVSVRTVSLEARSSSKGAARVTTATRHRKTAAVQGAPSHRSAAKARAVQKHAQRTEGRGRARG